MIIDKIREMVKKKIFLVTILYKRYIKYLDKFIRWKQFYRKKV